MAKKVVIKDEKGNKKTIQKEPIGIDHHYAPLAILTDGKTHGCRTYFNIPLHKE